MTGFFRMGSTRKRLRNWSTFYGVVMLFVVFPFTLHAQTSATVRPDSVVFGVLPALGYSSDIGFVAGGLISRYHYREDVQPFQNYGQMAVLATTRGLFSFMFSLDQVEPLGLTDFRARNIFNTGRVLEGTYFGIGNNTPFTREQWDDEYYFYENYYLTLESRVRHTIWESDTRKNSRLDLVFISDVRQQAPQLKSAGNLLSESGSTSRDGGWTWMGGLGLQWENRDSEFAPTRGNTFLVELRASPGLASDYALYHLNVLATQYATTQIVFPVTAAFKIGYLQTGGDVPFFVLPEIGGEYTLRGYPQARFRDDAGLYYTAELRTWLLQFPAQGFRLGGQLFTDGGRVYSSGEVLSAFFNDHHSTYGFGASMSVFTYDFIVRADLGFSDELSRLYLGIGYTF